MTGTQLLRGPHFVRLLLATDGLSAVKKSKPEKALASRKHRYCAVVEQFYVRQFRIGRLQIFFTRKTLPHEPVNKKSERLFDKRLIFHNFFERGVWCT